MSGFRWPPGGVERAEGAAGAEGAERALEVRTDSEGGGAPELALGARTERARNEGVWRSIERVWLGESAPPLEARLAGWSPDEPEAYCPRCATSVGAFEADAEGCAACRGRRLAWEGAVRLGSYTGALRDVIHDVKFHRDRAAGSALGSLLGEAVAVRLMRAGVHPATALVVPVPTTYRRRVERGVDHALSIARGVARAGSMELAPVLRRSHRASQTSLAPSRRRRNVSGSMRLRAGVDLGGRVVVVVDDVRTTGATMTEACRALSRGSTGGVRAWSCVAGVTASGRR